LIAAILIEVAKTANNKVVCKARNFFLLEVGSIVFFSGYKKMCTLEMLYLTWLVYAFLFTQP